MTQSQYRNVEIERGGLYAKRDPRSYVVRQAAAELQERIFALLGGRRKSRKLGRVQCGESKPLTEPMELAVELKFARVPFAETFYTIITPQVRQLAELYGRQFDTDEFTPPTDPAPAQQQQKAA